MKAQEIGELRALTLPATPRSYRTPPRRCGSPSSRVASCWRSATAARPPTRWTSWPTSAAGGTRRRIDLTEDPAILTAIANDIGTEAIFLRQVIAYGCPATR